MESDRFLRLVNIHSEKKSLIFHPFIFSCLPILFSLAFNAHEISIDDIIVPIIISITIAFIFWIILRHFVGGVKSGLVVSFLILLLNIKYLKSQLNN